MNWKGRRQQIPNGCGRYGSNYHYGYRAVVNELLQTRDGLLSVANTLNMGHMNPNGTRNEAGWVASSYGYDLDAPGRRVTHRERLKRRNNFNGWLALNRRVDRTFTDDFRDQLATSTSTFPEGDFSLLPPNTAEGRLAEAENYTYDALGYVNGRWGLETFIEAGMHNIGKITFRNAVPE